jgi:glycosyltransferase involved in cell wall biosynthesis
MIAVHQLLPVLSPGDAIGAAVLRTRVMLLQMGFRSEIFAGLIDHRLQRAARPETALPGRLAADDVLVYHLSIGSPLARLVARSSVRTVVVYHNITPADYYRDINPIVSYWLQRGRRDLAALAPHATLVIGDSRLNLEEALAAGARHATVVPPAVDLGRLRPEPARPSSDAPVVIFTGRLASNKGHEHLIRAVAALRALALPSARLTLVGGGDDTEPYARALRDLAERVGVGSAVRLTGRVSDSELREIYATAAVFACASEHEGFCVPLLEAMAFSVPIVAFAAAAVPETVGPAGLLTATRNPLVWAALLEVAIRSAPTRRSLIAAGHRRLADFSDDSVFRRLRDALASVGIVAT